MIRKSAWLLSAGLTILATPALAQSSAPTTESGRPTTAPPTQGSTAENAAVQNQAQEQQPVDTSNIVITATRRNQALSDVPMAVSAVTAQNLEYTGATDIRQLNQVAPSLFVFSTTSEAGAARANIRGIGTVGDNPGLESSVGVFIDGVYRSRTGVGLTELGALDRIEVLRGPQGTLFGRNTSAGLISIITAKPRFEPEISGQIDAGNYNFVRGEISATGPLTDTVAVRLDAVYVNRDGFLHDVISGRDINDRNRALVRGQVLFQPNDKFTFRLIGDASKQREECCGAVYLPASDATLVNGQVVRSSSTVAGIMRGLGATIIDNPSRRDISITRGRDYDSRVNDGGISGEANYDFGWGNLTSITAYRYDKYTRGQDADFNDLDILYRSSDGGSYNRFKTFSQELRLQGQAFGNHLDWLVGGYYANEKLRVVDNLAYGADYTRYTNCDVVLSAFPQGLNPAAPGCVSQPAITTAISQLTAGINLVTAGIGQIQAALANPATPPSQIPALQAQLAALQAQLATLTAQRGQLAAYNGNGTNPGFASLAAQVGLPGFDQSTVSLNDRWDQTSNNWALFTHNIISLNDRLKLTIGARYTHERKTLNADLNDNNTLCVNLFATPLAGFGQLPCIIPGAPGGHLDLHDAFSESKVSGTAVLSYKATDRLLAYASYSRGYKGGGFNLDRSALFRASTTANGLPGFGPICISQTQLRCQGTVASGADLRFKPEINDAYEVGAKYNGSWFDINLAIFHQLFTDFQLNTFNGLNFLVENINSCANSLGGADKDNNPTTGACSGDKRAGVEDNGFELEAFTRPLRNLAINGGVTLSNAKYRDNLVGVDGRPLTNALFQLPGRRVSGAPKWTITGSAAWTPPIGTSGLRGLLYADFRHMSTFNTGSDLDLEKVQKAFTIVNARAGVHGSGDAWGIEIWAQNLFDKTYKQVAFDSPLQPGGVTNTLRGLENGSVSRVTQLYSAFLGEPRTFGVTLRGRLGFHHAAPVPYVPAPAPVAEPAPPPPPPPPPPPAPVERGERG